MTIRKILRSNKDEHIQPFIDCILSGNAIFYLKSLRERNQTQELGDEQYLHYLVKTFFISLICTRDYGLKRKQLWIFWNTFSDDLIAFFKTTLSLGTSSPITIDSEMVFNGVDGLSNQVSDEESFFSYLETICCDSSLFIKKPYSEELIKSCINFFLRSRVSRIINSLLNIELIAFFIFPSNPEEPWEKVTYNHIIAVLNSTCVTIGQKLNELVLNNEPLLEWFVNQPIRDQEWLLLKKHIKKILSSDIPSIIEILTRVSLNEQNLLEWYILEPSKTKAFNWKTQTYSNIENILNCTSQEAINHVYNQSLKVGNQNWLHFYIRANEIPDKNRALKIFNSSLKFQNKTAFYQEIMPLNLFSLEEITVNKSLHKIHNLLTTPQPAAIPSEKRKREVPAALTQRKKVKLAEPVTIDNKTLVKLLKFVHINYINYINEYEPGFLQSAKSQDNNLDLRLLVFKQLMNHNNLQQLTKKNTALTPFLLKALGDIMPIFNVLILGIENKTFPRIRYKDLAPSQYLPMCQTAIKTMLDLESKQNTPPPSHPTNSPTIISNAPQSFFANRIPEQWCGVMSNLQYQQEYNSW